MKFASTWTQEELLSDLTSLKDHLVWRMVEAQHTVATLSIAKSIDDQITLEEILEETKPPLPAGINKNMHYLLSTPFRYKSASGSRFRQPSSRDGVFYCAENMETAAYEIAFYMALFYNESPNLEYPKSSQERTAFSTKITSDKVLDLTTHPSLKQFSNLWENYADYTECQQLASDARKAGIEVIAYKSVRDPQGRKNYAILNPSVLENSNIVSQTSWNIILKQDIIYARCENPPLTLSVDINDLKKDPRF